MSITLLGTTEGRERTVQSHGLFCSISSSQHRSPEELPDEYRRGQHCTYFFGRQRHGGLEVVYVGVSSNVLARFRQHTRSGLLTMAPEWCVREFATREEAEAVERYLILAWQPDMNIDGRLAS